MYIKHILYNEGCSEKKEIEIHIKTCVLCKALGNAEKRGSLKENFLALPKYGTAFYVSHFLLINHSTPHPSSTPMTGFPISVSLGWILPFVRPPSSGMTETYSTRHFQPLFAHGHQIWPSTAAGSAVFKLKKWHCKGMHQLPDYKAFWPFDSYMHSLHIQELLCCKKFYIFLKTVWGDRLVLLLLKENSTHGGQLHGVKFNLRIV